MDVNTRRKYPTVKNTYTLKRMAIKIHCSSLFTCRPLGLGGFPAVFFPRILVLTPGTSPPVFVLFVFRFVIGLVLTPRRVWRLSRGTISEEKKSKHHHVTSLTWSTRPITNKNNLRNQSNSCNRCRARENEPHHMFEILLISLNTINLLLTIRGVDFW